MQSVLTAEEMREADYESVIKLRVTERQLMELAGKEACNILLEKFADADGKLAGKRFLIVSGKGNNGGDGIVLARHLINAGATVDLIHLCEESQLKPDGAATLKTLKQYLIHTDKIRVFEADEFFPEVVLKTRYDFAVDAVLGTGYRSAKQPKSLTQTGVEPPQKFEAEPRPALSEVIKNAVLFINAKKKEGAYVVALDMPTGTDGTSGAVPDVAVEADLTITLAFLKTGLFLGEGRRHAGEIALADISIPDFLAKPSACKLTDENFVRRILPERAAGSAKHQNGKVLIVAGSQGAAQSMMGAAIMSVRAALASGAGYVCAAVPESAFNLMHQAAPEAILISQDMTQIAEKIEWADAVAVGCGLGRSPEQMNFAAKLLSLPALQKKKTIIDADALFAIAELSLLDSLQLSDAILTPHVKELERLIRISAQEIESERLFYVKEFAKRYAFGLLLKGSPTLIAANEKLFLCNSGTAALATAGTGDVLSGLIVSFAAQGLSTADAAAAAAYIHGLAGSFAGKSVNRISATDVINSLVPVFNYLENPA
ncbi:carbohydrate kinase, YjeF related protein [Chloroherpeton thalassium ATCC 35110]|uniref:Bifunctional NAD(P)H-hydrate repair enzyme n=1 Tax=Chloroherpeton thalassium (strain ATCC 35110 / GB-78) TaxID=517418 RepID=B3QRU9_CHLT3|nr:NAD(P)H-hydrate dehydratase [Chloroherpeton thalassium]ACF13902.1 carbohydrate kinase, YjeF related protein [Chloroherpeton thalassium ATCC 35110]